MRLLIVEDQTYTLEALEFAVKRVMPKYFPGFTKDIAKWYTRAEDLIAKNSYDFVILDHRMPRDDPGCTDLGDNFEKFCSTLKDIGYGLIGDIKKKNPKAVVIGTSSAGPYELRGKPAPDYKLNKTGDVEQDLDTIMKEILSKS